MYDPHELEALYKFRDWLFKTHDPILERDTFSKKIKWAIFDLVNNAIVEFIETHQMKETRDEETKEVL